MADMRKTYGVVVKSQRYLEVLANSTEDAAERAEQMAYEASDDVSWEASSVEEMP